MLSAVTQDILRERFPTLHSLPASLWEQLTAQAGTRRYAPDDVLFDSGKTCDAYPLLLTGTVRIVEGDERGRELALYRIAPGDLCVLTLAAFLRQRAQTARGVADTDVTAVMLPQSLFDLLLAQHAPFRAYVFGLFAARMGDLMQVTQAVAFQRLDQRLAALLLAKSGAATFRPDSSPPPHSSSETQIIHTTHQKLADELGSVREIVSRLLRRFETQGLIALGREQIRILNAPNLHILALSSDP